MVGTAGRQFRSGRKVYMFGIYIPPKMRVGTFNDMMDCLINEIKLIKSSCKDPILIIGGDMNRRDFGRLTSSFPDMALVNAGPSRGTVHLDLLTTNIENMSAGNGLFAPLKSIDGTKTSDHSIISSSNY